MPAYYSEIKLILKHELSSKMFLISLLQSKVRFEIVTLTVNAVSILEMIYHYVYYLHTDDFLPLFCYCHGVSDVDIHTDSFRYLTLQYTTLNI